MGGTVARRRWLWQLGGLEERTHDRVGGQPSQTFYEPSVVRRVEIEKPGSGTRLLGIPTVVDRLIQQAILQVVQRAIDPTFSAHSYGFGPGRSAHDRYVRRKGTYRKTGIGWWMSIWRSSSTE